MAISANGVNYKTQILNLNLRWDTLPGVPQTSNMITYNGKSFFLNVTNKDEFQKNLPESFKNDKEKITKFAVISNEDHTIEYFLECVKTVFDFRTREYVSETRDCTSTYTNFQLEELKNYVIKFYGQLYITEFEEESEILFNKFRNSFSIKHRVKIYRDELLKESDKYMLPDYPITDDVREEWKIYRQKLRDITDNESWADDIVNLEFPTPPDYTSKIKLFLYDGGIDIKSILKEQIELSDVSKESLEELCKKVVTMTVKMDILQEFSKFDLPEFQSIGDFVSLIDINAIQNASPEDKISTLSDLIEERLSGIDEILNEANLNFTVADVLNTVVQYANDMETEELDPAVQEAIGIIESI